MGSAKAEILCRIGPVRNISSAQGVLQTKVEFKRFLYLKAVPDRKYSEAVQDNQLL